MQKALNVKFVEGLKPSKERQVISDLVSPNLVLTVSVAGAKTWSWRGRINGAKRYFTLGPFPVHDLHAARDWANEISAQRDLGIDIMAQRAAEAAAATVASTRTVDWLFDLYMANEGDKRRTAASKRQCYNRDIKPVIGQMAVEDVDHDVLAGIVRKKSLTAPVQSNRLCSLIQRMFRWSVTKGRDLTKLTVNPAADLVKLADETAKRRFLSDYEIGLFFQVLPSMNGFAEPLAMILYTGARKSEVFQLPWKEIDLERGLWILDESRAKNAEELVLPLATTTIAMLRERREGSQGKGLVWPSAAAQEDEEERGMSGFSKVTAKLNKEMQLLAAKDDEVVASFTIHDLRRTLATGMNNLLDEEEMPLVAPDVVERILNHKIKGVAGIYNRSDYLAPKRRALKLWADHLDQIRSSALPTQPTP